MRQIIFEVFGKTHKITSFALYLLKVFVCFPKILGKKDKALGDKMFSQVSLGRGAC